MKESNQMHAQDQEQEFAQKQGNSQKRFRRPSPFQIIASILIMALLLSNIWAINEIKTLHTWTVNEIETLQAVISQNFSSSAESTANAVNTISILQQAVTMGVHNQDDFLTLLEKNARSKSMGGGGYSAFYEQIEPQRVPWYLRKNAKTLSNYIIRPYDTYKNSDGGSTTYYGSAIQPDENVYHLRNSSGFCVTLDLGQLALNPYGIFEGDIYLIYDDSLDEQSSGSMLFFIYNETDRSEYKASIPFVLHKDAAGLILSNQDSLATSIYCHNDGTIDFSFSVNYDGKAPQTYARREIGVNMIGNVMVYAKSDYDNLPYDE